MDWCASPAPPRRSPSAGSRHRSRRPKVQGPSIYSSGNVGKIYDNGTPAVIDFNLEVDKGEFIAFLGPSGFGKTTTLRMIAGFRSHYDGRYFHPRPSHQRRAAGAPADGDDFSELCAVSAHDGAGQRSLRSRRQEAAGSRPRGEGRAILEKLG